MDEKIFRVIMPDGQGKEWKMVIPDPVLLKVESSGKGLVRASFTLFRLGKFLGSVLALTFKKIQKAVSVLGKRQTILLGALLCFVVFLFFSVWEWLMPWIQSMQKIDTKAGCIIASICVGLTILLMVGLVFRNIIKKEELEKSGSLLFFSFPFVISEVIVGFGSGGILVSECGMSLLWAVTLGCIITPILAVPATIFLFFILG